MALEISTTVASAGIKHRDANIEVDLLRLPLCSVAELVCGCLQGLGGQRRVRLKEGSGGGSCALARSPGADKLLSDGVVSTFGVNELLRLGLGLALEGVDENSTKLLQR